MHVCQIQKLASLVESCFDCMRALDCETKVAFSIHCPSSCRKTEVVVSFVSFEVLSVQIDMDNFLAI